MTRSVLIPLAVVGALGLAACESGEEEHVGETRQPPRAAEPARPARGPTASSAEATPLGRWSAIEAGGAPAGRDRFGGAALGRKLAVWGGHSVEGQFQTYLNSGAIYDPRARRWTDLPTNGAPSARQGHVVLALDGPLLLYGGRDGMAPVSTGAIYDPDAQRFRATPPLGAPPPASDASAVFTGDAVILWGGLGETGVHRATGAVLDLATFTFRPTSEQNAPSPRAGHRAVWTGERMIVWGGVGSRGPLGDGASYDPVRDEWHPLPSDGAPSPRLRHALVWTGEEVIVWGGDRDGTELPRDAAAYHPGENAWRALRSSEQRTDHVAVFTGERVVVWGGAGPNGLRGDGIALDVRADTIRPIATEGAPSARRDAVAVWTGEEMIVWGGRAPETAEEYPKTGGVFRP